MVGGIVNATVSHAPISFVEVQGDEPTWFIAHAPTRVPAPLPLVNGCYLYLYHSLGLRRPQRYLTTLEYRYSYQATSDPESWIFRYEHIREPPEDYGYPISHVHINGKPASYKGERPFSELHLPTGKRVTIELLIRHLVAEHGIRPISEKWEDVLREGEAHFREIQKKRLTPD